MADQGNPSDFNEFDKEEDGAAQELQKAIEDEEDGDAKELQKAIEASVEDYALQLQLEEVMAFSQAFYTSQPQLEEEPTSSKSQLQLEDEPPSSKSQLQLDEEPTASKSANVPSSSNSNPASSATLSEDDDAAQDSVGKRPGSGNISVPSPKRARREGKEVVEGNEDAALVKEQCSICLEAKYPSEFFDGMVCSHRFCSTCITMHVRSKLQEKLVTIHCPEPNCSEYLSPQQCQLNLPKQILELWWLALAEAEIPSSQRFYCPYKDCSALLVKDVPEIGSSNGAADVVIKQSECPECNRLFCAQCGVPWHAGLDCSDLQKLSPSEKEKDDLLLFKLAKEKDWQRCGKCGRMVEKTSGCCHMICSHKIYMKIQEEMVILLDEKSWEDVKCNYPESSSMETLKQFYVAFKKMPKRGTDGVPPSFKIHIQKAKIERQRRQFLTSVELDDTLDHYVWNGLNTVQYKVILGDCEDIANLVPKKEYSLVIADIPHGYNIQNTTYDCTPYTYQSFSKVVSGFIDVTTSPLWRFLVFHSDTQLGGVLTSFKDKGKTRKQLHWHKPNIRSSNNDPFLSDIESIHLAAWTKDESYDSLLINAKSKGKHSQALNYNAVVRKLTYEERHFKGVTVNIYQKPQALINYLIDTFSREGDWVLDLFSGSGTIIACSLQKGRNCISIDNDPLQCNYIKQRVNAIPVLPDELQEVGLKKGEFSETLVAKMSKEPQPPLGGVFGKDHFGHLVDIEDPMEEEIVVPEESQAPENSNLDEVFALHDILH